MNDVKYERGKTLMYPTMYPRLLITPVFAYKGDFMWIESIVCKYDSDIDDIEEPEFEFMRSTVHSERNDALKAENAKLLELVRKYGEYIDQDHCEGCVCKSRCSNGDVDECWQLIEIRELASKSGIRVS